MTLSVKILYLGVIGPFMTNIHGRQDGTPVGVDTTILKQVSVKLLIEIIYRVVKGEHNELGRLGRANTTWTDVGEAGQVDRQAGRQSSSRVHVQAGRQAGRQTEEEEKEEEKKQNDDKGKEAYYCLN